MITNKQPVLTAQCVNINIPSYSVTHNLPNSSILGIGISEGTQYVDLGIEILFDQ